MMTNRINTPLVIECLRELSDRALQRRLWLSTGQDDVSSYTEAVEQLFTDSGLGDELARRTTGLGSDAEDALVDLRESLTLVDPKLPPGLLIESAEMEMVRRSASAALSVIGV
jgi:hypothetical protein